MNTYVYEGPVMRFDTIVANNWRSETAAVSTEKARSNLKYRYKKQNGLAPSARIDLPGKITVKEQPQ